MSTSSVRSRGGGFHRGFTQRIPFQRRCRSDQVRNDFEMSCWWKWDTLDCSYNSGRMLDLETETEDHILSRKRLWDGWNGHTKFGGVRLSFTISTNTSFGAKYEDWAPNKSSVLLQ